MPRDIEALTAQFESSNNAEKTTLFKDVINEIILDIQREAFISSSDSIRETLEVFSSIDMTSSEITLFTNQIRDHLRDIQHNYTDAYSAQIEHISALLDFLRPPDTEQEFFLDDNNNSTYSRADKEEEENTHGTSAPIPIPVATTHTSEANPQNYTTIVSGSYVSGFNGKMAYNLKDTQHRSFLGEDYDPGGGIM